MNNKSNFTNMRRLHINIKGKLIIHNSIKNCYVLDVSVGRFGDIHNYYRAGIRRLVGIDPDKSSIEEAKKRSKCYNDLRAELRVECISNETILLNGTFDLVVCNFTLHYLFESEEMLENSIRNISNRLREGGFFEGTTLDGSKLDKTLNDCEFVEYKPLDEHKYQFKLIDDKHSGNYFIECSSNIEYKVNLKTFRDMCAKYKLSLLECKPFDEYKWDRSKFNESERRVSSLYCSFVFIKTN